MLNNREVDAIRSVLKESGIDMPRTSKEVDALSIALSDRLNLSMSRASLLLYEYFLRKKILSQRENRVSGSSTGCCQH